MSEGARERIQARLRQAVAGGGFDIPRPRPLAVSPLSQAERVALLKTRMEAVKAEVHVVPTAQWLDSLKSVLREKGVSRLSYGPNSEPGKSLMAAWKSNGEGPCELVPYESDIEEFKSSLFAIDAGITTASGGIADTGALILWPDDTQPRLLSLVPPIHIAVVDAEAIYHNLAEAIQAQNWGEGTMPSNLLLISGPSKTADIELTLAFGVHGPKQLIVFVRE